MRVVVVGHGMVGSRVAEELVTADPTAEVTVLGKEPVPAYNRVLLSSVVAGSKDPSLLSVAGPAHPRLRVLTGVGAVDVDRTARVVHDDAGETHPYDALVLATGSAARVPAIQGVALDTGLVPGVFVLKDMADATGIVEATRSARRAVVLGAGVLGIEVATGLAARGLAVRVVHLGERLMERQLGWEASQVAVASLERMGITTHVGSSVVGVTTRRGRLDGVRFGDGLEAAADLFVMCTGTVPDTMLARRAGLTCDRGVVVEDDLRSPDDPAVFAVGDCAQPPGGATGLVAQGWEQARRVVLRLARADAVDPAASTTDVVRVKASGMSMVSMGLSGDFDRDDPRHRVLSLKDPERGRFVEVVVSGGMLVGATCLGDAEVGATLSALYTRSMPVPEDPALLMVRALSGGGPGVVSRAPADLEDGDRVCTCNSVTAGTIRAALADGCRTAADVSARTRASTGCGDCRTTVEALVAHAADGHQQDIEHDPDLVRSES
ncbi:NAD(P)/FAD-dependent oxidoreductase [Phycicoccus sp. CSK15P-2]|uniref:FAD-dependent oxidoreductase n=1 Tax=Phycicoccus sp. CSK15P-2 TaxID=2807627 RepID=UPI00194EB806|nr:FAD-dependent oxidoreductase [Phycicoccus sp. CSK15P-2]MBM6404979.1 NAD(P)/FAD-dependent oxidoreductase [Phycicoccus sp. CSK15P-2]